MDAFTAPAQAPAQAHDAEALPRFEVALTPPDLGPWRAGNTGIPGFTSVAAPCAGPHVLILGLIHGNELAGAIALDALLRAGVRPARGRLTIGFANLAAFDRFDPQNPVAARFIDEDMNRLWDEATLDGARRSCELDRARAIRPVIDRADRVLDLHSMLWPSDPLMLCGQGPRGKNLAMSIASPNLVVADRGHAAGRRLIDYPRFTAPHNSAAAVLVEAGQHWQPETVVQMNQSIAGLLAHAGMTTHTTPTPSPPVFAAVSHVITANTARFAFVRNFRGGDIIPHRNTLLAYDGIAEIRTPHNDCLLVMPSQRTGRGHTAVRLAQFHRNPD